MFMRARKVGAKAFGVRSVVRARIPLAGLERVAATFNEFRDDPLQGGRLANRSADEQWMYWLSRFAGVGPDQPVLGIPEVVQTLLRNVVGAEGLDRLRPCAWCGRWMVARRRDRLRCSQRCHSKEWTRAQRRRAKERARNVPATASRGTVSAHRQPKKKQKTRR